MPDNSLQPGELVVELAAVVQSVAIFSGVLAAMLVSWITKRSWTISCISLLVGGVIGLLVGMVASHLVYDLADGTTTVVRVGSSSLPQTIDAALAGTLPTALIIAGAAVCLLSAPPKSAFTTSLMCSVAIGLGFAYFSSLL
jgi:hypothetical protein